MEDFLKENTLFVVADQQDAPVDVDEITTAAHPILIVNDDPDLLKIMTRTLEDAGYTVAAVSSGYEALQWIQAAGAVGELPALILLDLDLPAMYRPQMAKALRQQGRNGVEPIIVTSTTQSTHQRIPRVQRPRSHPGYE